MTAVLRVSSDDLQRVASANTGLLDVARSLAELAKSKPDTPEAKKLYEQIDKLLETSRTIADAVTAAVTPSR